MFEEGSESLMNQTLELVQETSARETWDTAMAELRLYKGIVWDRSRVYAVRLLDEGYQSI